MKQIIYYKSLKQRNRSILTYCLMTIILVYFLKAQYHRQDYYVGIFYLIFAIISLFSLFKNVKNTSTVVVDSSGIMKNTNLIGLIEWRFIDHFELKKVFRSTVIIIHLTNSKDFLKTKNLFSRLMMRRNSKKLGSLTAIGQLEIEQPLEEVIKDLQKYKKTI